jgi:Tfp pilus assembly protein PilF
MTQLLTVWVGVFLLSGANVFGQTNAAPPKAQPQILSIEGRVEVLPVNTTTWLAAKTNQVLKIGDKVRTMDHSRATVRLSELTVERLRELTTIQIRPPRDPAKGSLLDVNAGSIYFLSRERPAKQEFRTPSTSGAIRGTEFNLDVAPDGSTVLALVDGLVTLSNEVGHLEMISGEQAEVAPNKAPVKIPMIEAVNIIQWCLYYPGVLDPDDLELSADDRRALVSSLSAYSSGDLLQAVALFPANSQANSYAAQVYHAATLLSAGQVEEAQQILNSVEADSAAPQRAKQLSSALRLVIASVKNQPAPSITAPSLATEWLANSYYLQSQARLGEALAAARAAVERSPRFGFAWARVAELELAFGRLSKASEAVEKSLALSPRNAQSLTVEGFILLAHGRGAAAQDAFDQAIALDGALANAWLGRGLTRIRRGDSRAGLDDLQVAAVQEPQRAVLRSYLGKAFSNAGDDRRASKELALAQRLDSRDPTAYLYLALVEQEENQVNRAIRDLEESERLNDNRRLFRSKLLLDQDEAVRGANLASVYQDAGILNWNKDVAMSDWSVREASRAVNNDYGNFAAHQFLANSYDALRDPRQLNLRYETPWFSELLMAHLLAPVGAGNLSEFAAQRDYSRLFEENRFGFSSDTEYLSHGDWLERASHFGTWGPVAYAFDADYRSERGWRPNNDFESLTLSLKGKVQLTPHDSLYLEGVYYDTTFGDTAQYYYQYGATNPALSVLQRPSTSFRAGDREWGRFDEPNLFLGFHHEWAPGVHTLFLGARQSDAFNFTDTNHIVPFIPFSTFGGGTNYDFRPTPFPVEYNRLLEAYTAELQQIIQTEYDWFGQTLVVGGRYQAGSVKTLSSLTIPANPFVFPPNPIFINDNLESDLTRYNIYGYETLRFDRWFELTGGVSYDHLRYPVNIETAPLSSEEATIDQVSPKVGGVFSPFPDTHIRAAYTRSLGGEFSLQSVRLEPTQIAGFNQAFRSITPESVGGAVPGARFTTWGFGLDQSFKTHTYFSLEYQHLASEATRTLGIITNSSSFSGPDSPGQTRQHLNYKEDYSIILSLNQLICDQWSVGARYQISRAQLESRFVDQPSGLASAINQDLGATLGQLSLYANYYHPCGFFSQFQYLWMNQDNQDAGLADSDFWQLNLYAGYRFPRRAAEVKVGLLNLTDQDYKLNPLNLYYDLPRQRTVSLSFKFYF